MSLAEPEKMSRATGSILREWLDTLKQLYNGSFVISGLQKTIDYEGIYISNASKRADYFNGFG